MMGEYQARKSGRDIQLVKRIPYEEISGVPYLIGVSNDTCNSVDVFLGLAVLPIGFIDESPALTYSCDVALLIISGRAKAEFGDDLRWSIMAHERDFIHIPAGIQHKIVNAGPSTLEIAVARTVSDADGGICIASTARKPVDLI